jgi:hypothetical protein
MPCQQIPKIFDFYCFCVCVWSNARIYEAILLIKDRIKKIKRVKGKKEKRHYAKFKQEKNKNNGSH